jgi:hypothetical protein
MLFAERLEASGQVHRVPMHRVALAAAAADIAGYQRARIDPDAPESLSGELALTGGGQNRASSLEGVSAWPTSDRYVERHHGIARERVTMPLCVPMIRVTSSK